ncbi:hypothetical protein [Pseudaminobacter soli (ex Zhang et al. 2022)]|uniref:hypothetical protein n=1 Tax=Pseudaminobacter soli (ex Zhang et al. 2022) TaxID=2831468 RepID=UPI003CC7F9C8
MFAKSRRALLKLDVGRVHTLDLDGLRRPGLFGRRVVMEGSRSGFDCLDAHRIGWASKS